MNTGIDPSRTRQLALWRWSAFALGCAAFFISFFHRVSTGSIAANLQDELAIGAAALGTLGATYFYVYALMQVPSGVLADTLGPRVTLTMGMLIAGVGSIAYGLAETFTAAAVARTCAGLGVSGVFVCTLKLHSNWFHERRFATAVGAANVAGIAGALAATAPLAWLITRVSWRSVFVAIGAASLVLALAIWLFVRESPHAQARHAVTGNWRRALLAVVVNPATWPPFWVNVGVSGAYMTFIGLWAVPFLMHAHPRALLRSATFCCWISGRHSSGIVATSRGRSFSDVRASGSARCMRPCSAPTSRRGRECARVCEGATPTRLRGQCSKGPVWGKHLATVWVMESGWKFTKHRVCRELQRRCSKHHCRAGTGAYAG